jgi:hypothetical protein
LGSLNEIANNVLFDGPEALKALGDQAPHISRAEFKYFLDPSMFKEDGSLRIEAEGTEKIFLADPTSPPPKRLYRTGSARGPPWMVEISPALMVKVGGKSAPTQVMAKLQLKRVRKAKLKLISLITDFSTEVELERSPLASNVAKLPIPTEDAIRDILRSNPGETVAILAHVEGERYLVKDSSGDKVLLELPIERLSVWAKEFKCDIIHLGCSAGREGSGVGAVNAFNPIDAVRRLSAAMNEKYYDRFVAKLSGDELGLVVDDTAFAHATADVETDFMLEAYERSATDWSKSVRFSSPVIVGGIAFGSPSKWTDSGWTMIYWLVGPTLLALVWGYKVKRAKRFP